MFNPVHGVGIGWKQQDYNVKSQALIFAYYAWFDFFFKLTFTSPRVLKVNTWSAVTDRQ